MDGPSPYRTAKHFQLHCQRQSRSGHNEALLKFWQLPKIWSYFPCLAALAGLEIAGNSLFREPRMYLLTA